MKNWTQCYKTFSVHNLRTFVISQSVSHRHSFSSLVLCFWVRPEAYHRMEHLKRCFTWLGLGLAYKQQTRLERFARNKHSSLLRKSVNYGQKKFYNIGPWAQCYKTFYVLNLRMFLVSQSVCPWQTSTAQSNVND